MIYYIVRHPVRGAISKAKIARNMRSKRHPVRGAISKAKIRWKKNSLSPNVCPNVVALSENVTSNNVASKRGVRHKCGGSPKCGVKQCGVKMWRQAQMWRQSEMWRQTMWRQNVTSNTPLTKLCFRKCVFKKGIQWQAQKYYTICLYPVFLYIHIFTYRYSQ